jgi:transcriptional regulator with XRE-family HTH domain
VVAFLGYDPAPAPTTLTDRLEAKRRLLGVTIEQVARHLGWDPGSLRRYLDGTWHLSSERQALLEAFLDASPETLPAIYKLRRRNR